jgi:GT2 family glycosyltransferase
LKVYIIILNYNGWQDSIECLESVLRMDYPNFKVILVENGSTDNSREMIERWAKGWLDSWVHPSHALKGLTYPPLKKPLKYSLFSVNDIRTDKSAANKIMKSGDKLNREKDFILIRSAENLGFTKGNNVGIRFALQQQDADFVWLLNNDTVVAADALTRLVKKAKLEEKVGITGSRLMFYNNPEKLQALGGGVINPLWSSSRHVLKKKDLRKMNYIVGASFLISRRCIEDTGFLCEDFFVYSDDADYCLNASRHGFTVAAANDSIVYHRLGQAASDVFKDYYGIRNNLCLSVKYFKKYLFFNFLYIGLRLLKRLILLRFRGFLAGVRGISDCFRGKMGRQF